LVEINAGLIHNWPTISESFKNHKIWENSGSI
jgi:hypothetical protein